MNEENMKMLKFAIFLKTKLKINVLEIKYIVKTGSIAIIHGNIAVLHITYGNVPKEVLQFSKMGLTMIMIL